MPPARGVDRAAASPTTRSVGRQGGAGQVGEEPVDEDREGDLQRQVRVADREGEHRERQPAERAPHEQRHVLGADDGARRRRVEPLGGGDADLGEVEALDERVVGVDRS